MKFNTVHILLESFALFSSWKVVEELNVFYYGEAEFVNEGYCKNLVLLH